MTDTERTNNWDPDVSRVSQELASRLKARGVEVDAEDSPDDVLKLVEAVEEFEATVVELGGDLMVDEPPATGRAQPDDPHFLLPTRAADESVSAYTKRLRTATTALRGRRPQS